jgi:hypothetical protein
VSVVVFALAKAATIAFGMEPFERSSMVRITATMSALGPASDRQFPLRRLAETIGESLETAE